MRLDDFAAMHPTLTRLAMRGAADGIRRHGLLTARDLAGRAGVALPDTRRPKAIPLTLLDGTEAWITDNHPLSEKRLAGILDDGLTPTDWMAMLNGRVFFWPDPRLAEGNLAARRRHGYPTERQTYDTARLLGPVWDRAEVAPFNTGTTVHVPPRRGHSTFAPLASLDFDTWRRARGLSALDRVKEVTVRGSLPEAGAALLSVEPA